MADLSHFVDKHRDHLIHSVRKVEPVLDELLINGVIQQKHCDDIKALPTSEEQMRKLFDCLTDAGDRDKDILFNVIKKLEPDFIKLIMLRDAASVSVGHGEDFIRQNLRVNLKGFTLQWLGPLSGSSNQSTMAQGSQMSPEHDWIKLEPEVNYVDVPTYRLQSKAGNYECSVSGLRWVCKEKVSFKYQFGSWEEHMERIQTNHQYMVGGPLMDITVIAGKFKEVYLPHWICTDDNPTILDKFAVLHIDTCGDVVEQVSEVTPSHVKLSQPVFSPRGVLVKAGFPVKINCKVLIYKTSKAFLTLHVYLIPRDPALQETMKNKALSMGYKMIQKPYPEKSLKMRERFILTADKDGAEIYPETLKLVYQSSDPNFFEVFIENPDSNFQLTLRHETGPVWTSVIRKNDYQNTGDTLMMFDKELDKVRSKLVEKMSRKLINDCG
ncbi:NACHT, LRR and PYD domains-containing protein 1b allele 2-like [Larimichthys crocea]|uniref:NACHT, LRR and PYD domains-containing protein 1b allele 2-like n=1 Tax=Larimichthys crocea TaxID=215358 RepID=UPI000F5FE0EC|nr:NACHT, LRR and PYD domains-containing protein 1b allele 2-like [Larimichthys crocea]